MDPKSNGCRCNEARQGELGEVASSQLRQLQRVCRCKKKKKYGQEEFGSDDL